MKDVAVDACCLINLLAAGCVLPRPAANKKLKDSGQPVGSHSLGFVLHVPTIVAGESLYIVQPDHDDPSKLLKSAIDLESCFADGTLQRCEIEEGDETALFVGYATKLDDGEAACLAVARNRSWLLATDDRPATSLAVQVGITVLTTAELLKQWATNTEATKNEITTALLNIQRFAKFVPRPNSPEAAWWLSQVSTN